MESKSKARIFFTRTTILYYDVHYEYMQKASTHRNRFQSLRGTTLGHNCCNPKQQQQQKLLSVLALRRPKTRQDQLRTRTPPFQDCIIANSCHTNVEKANLASSSLVATVDSTYIFTHKRTLQIQILTHERYSTS